MENDKIDLADLRKLNAIQLQKHILSVELRGAAFWQRVFYIGQEK